jgi:hypothetical protein
MLSLGQSMKAPSLAELVSRTLLVLMSVTFSCAQRTDAQQIIPSMPPGGVTTTLSYFGSPVTCTNPSGIPTTFVFNYNLPDVSMANPSANVISINPPRMMQFFNIDPHTSLFIIAHECGHVHLPTYNESMADCFSATLGVHQGWFSSADMPAMTTEFASNPGDWTHPPGLERLANIQACMTNAGG